MRQGKEIAVVTPYFPTAAENYSGTFVRDQVVALCEFVDSVVVYLVKPWFRISRRFPFVAFRREDFQPLTLECAGARVQVLRYFPFPKDSVFYHLSLYLSLLTVRAKLPALVLAHTVYPVGVAVSRLGVSPTVITHGTDFRYFIRNPRQGESVRRLISRERLVCVGQGLKNELEAEAIEGARIWLVENGIPLFNRGWPETPSPEPGFDFVYVGNLVKTKGVYELLEAFGSLPEKARSVSTLTLIGDGVERSGLERMAAAMRGSAIRFLGTLENVQLREALANYQCLVLPSHKEGFGRVIVEMFSVGRPVIATVSGGPEYLVEKATGLLVQPRDVSALSHAMEEMIANYEQYDPGAIRAVAEARFDINRQTRRLLDVATESLA